MHKIFALAIKLVHVKIGTSKVYIQKKSYIRIIMANFFWFKYYSAILFIVQKNI